MTNKYSESVTTPTPKPYWGDLRWWRAELPAAKGSIYIDDILTEGGADGLQFGQTCGYELRIEDEHDCEVVHDAVFEIRIADLFEETQAFGRVVRRIRVATQIDVLNDTPPESQHWFPEWAPITEPGHGEHPDGDDPD